MRIVRAEPSRSQESKDSTMLHTSSKPGASQRDAGDDALKASEMRYRRLFETAQDGILILNADTGQIDELTIGFGINPGLLERAVTVSA